MITCLDEYGRKWVCATIQEAEELNRILDEAKQRRQRAELEHARNLQLINESATYGKSPVESVLLELAMRDLQSVQDTTPKERSFEEQKKLDLQIWGNHYVHNGIRLDPRSMKIELYPDAIARIKCYCYRVQEDEVLHFKPHEIQHTRYGFFNS